MLLTGMREISASTLRVWPTDEALAWPFVTISSMPLKKALRSAWLEIVQLISARCQSGGGPFWPALPLAGPYG